MHALVPPTLVCLHDLIKKILYSPPLCIEPVLDCALFVVHVVLSQLAHYLWSRWCSVFLSATIGSSARSLTHYYSPSSSFCLSSHLCKLVFWHTTTSFCFTHHSPQMSSCILSQCERSVSLHLPYYCNWMNLFMDDCSAVRVRFWWHVGQNIGNATLTSLFQLNAKIHALSPIAVHTLLCISQLIILKLSVFCRSNTKRITLPVFLCTVPKSASGLPELNMLMLYWTVVCITCLKVIMEWCRMAPMLGVTSDCLAVGTDAALAIIRLNTCT